MITTPDEQVLEEHSIKSTEASEKPAPKTAFPSPLLPRRLPSHQPKAGLNPISDAAAPLFSLCSRIRTLQHYRHLSKLHQELMHEVQQFQTTAKAQGYSSEHVLVSRYALCATLDDLIKNTAWGSQGQWDQYSLLSAFHPDTTNPDRFFTILERIIREPALYIDILELMYICLSLGFEGPFRRTAPAEGSPQLSSPQQFDRIIQGLYQQIRAYRGDFHKNLSPYLLKPLKPLQKNSPPSPLGWTLLLMSCFALMVMSGLGYSLGTLITQINQDIKQIGKSSFYENHS